MAAHMQQLVGERFINASRVFDADTAAVFVDVIGHTTETAVDGIADAIWPALKGMLSRPRVLAGAKPGR